MVQHPLEHLGVALQGHTLVGVLKIAVVLGEGEGRPGWRLQYPVPFNLTSLEEAFGPEEGRALGDKLIAAYGAERKVTILELRQNPDPEIAALADYVYEHVFVHYTMIVVGVEDVGAVLVDEHPVFVQAVVGVAADVAPAAYGAERKVTILELRQNPDPEIAALADYVYEHVRSRPPPPRRHTVFPKLSILSRSAHRAAYIPSATV